MMLTRSINTIIRFSKRPIVVSLGSEGKLIPDPVSMTTVAAPTAAASFSMTNVAAPTAAASSLALSKTTNNSPFSFFSFPQNITLALEGIVKPVPIAAAPVAPWTRHPLPFLSEMVWECDIKKTVNEIKKLYSQWLQECLHLDVKAFNERKLELQKAKATWSAVLRKSLKKEINKRGKVDMDDKLALYDYTSNGYGAMNNHKRGINMNDDSLPRRIQAVVRALGKQKLKVYRGKVYRHIEEMNDGFVQQLKAGATFSDKGFFSTSKIASFAEERESVGGGQVLFEVESRTGTDVKMYSRHPEEDEVLFRPDTLFMITHVSIGKYGGVHVKMYELH